MLHSFADCDFRLLFILHMYPKSYNLPVSLSGVDFLLPELLFEVSLFASCFSNHFSSNVGICLLY